jgi:hypothetical protein
LTNGQVTVTGVRVAGAKLAAFRTSRLGGDLDGRLFVDSEFVSLPENGWSLQTRSLLATGELGPPIAVPLDTQIAPNQAIKPVAAARLGDRMVWAFADGTRQFNPRAVFWVC